MNLKYPLNYIAITQYYKEGIHNGLDLGWSYKYGGNAVPIYAAGDGVITEIRKDYQETDLSGSSYGNYIKIKHDDTTSTLYAHLKYGSVNLNVGDTVKKGDQIAIMGETGHANGVHLHYEVYKNNVKVNPEEYTYVYPGQNISENPDATKGLLYLEESIPGDETVDELNKKIKELEDKIKLQEKEIEVLKQELNESEDFTFTYNVTKTSLYEINLYKGETLYIK